MRNGDLQTFCSVVSIRSEGFSSRFLMEWVPAFFDFVGCVSSSSSFLSRLSLLPLPCNSSATWTNRFLSMWCGESADPGYDVIWALATLDVIDPATEERAVRVSAKHIYRKGLTLCTCHTQIHRHFFLWMLFILVVEKSQQKYLSEFKFSQHEQECLLTFSLNTWCVRVTLVVSIVGALVSREDRLAVWTIPCSCIVWAIGVKQELWDVGPSVDDQVVSLSDDGTTIIIDFFSFLFFLPPFNLSHSPLAF